MPIRLIALGWIAVTSVIVTGWYWLAGAPGVFQSDGLVPVAFVHDWQHFPFAVGTFQLPRIPSLVPDLLTYVLLASWIENFRLALFGYATIQCAAFLALASMVVAKVSDVSFATGAAAMTAIFTIVLLLDWQLGLSHRLAIFHIYEHFGSWLLSLAAFLILLRLLRQESVGAWIGLGVLATLSLLSNKGFLVTFAVPAVLTAFYMRRSGAAIDARMIRRLAGCMAIALVAAMLLSLLLTTQSAPRISRILVHIKTMVVDLTMEAWRAPAAYVVCVYLPLVSFIALPFLAKDRFKPVSNLRLGWTFAAFSMACSAGFTALLYTDTGSCRYMVGVFYWPVIFLAVAAVLYAGAKVARAAFIVAGSVVAFIALRAADLAKTFKPWSDPLADCLLARKDELGLKDGLAWYWLARPTVISSGWRLQIEQMEFGTYYRWGNNIYWLTHSMFDPSRAPEFNFIIPGKQPPESIVQYFGEPQRRSECAGQAVWIYDRPLRITKIIDP